MISDAELCEGVRRLRGGPRLEVRVRGRAPLAGPEIGSGARFERIALELDGAVHRTVLKVMAADPLWVGFEQRFCEELAAALPARVPRVYGTGSVAGQPDGWVLLEEFPVPRRWTPARAFDALREIARVHAATLGRAPEWLPRPFARDLAASFAHTLEGLARLEALQAREPLVRDLATPRALALARALLAAPDAFRAAFAGSPECVVHRDFHPGNVWLPPSGPPILFDWESVCAGPPIFDATLLTQYLDVRQLRIPWRRAEVGFFLPGVPVWSELERAYLDALDEASGGAAPREAVASAANGAFAWEALLRLGWCASQLEEHAFPRTALRLRQWPWLRALGGLGDRAAMYAAWHAMFADFEARAAAILG